MSPRHSLSRRTGGSSRRRTEWFDGVNSTAVQNVVAIVSNAVTINEALTLVRIRGEMNIWVILATAIGDGFTTIDAGIGIASFDAVAAGVTSLPSPGTDKDWGGWVWHHSGGAIVGLETTEVGRFPIGARTIPIDTKAMRKLSPNESIFGSVALSTEVGTAAVNFTMNTRILFKLH